MPNASLEKLKLLKQV